jgi:hypothetical protein
MARTPAGTAGATARTVVGRTARTKELADRPGRRHGSQARCGNSSWTQPTTASRSGKYCPILARPLIRCEGLAGPTRSGQRDWRPPWRQPAGTTSNTARTPHMCRNESARVSRAPAHPYGQNPAHRLSGPTVLASMKPPPSASSDGRSSRPCATRDVLPTGRFTHCTPK